MARKVVLSFDDGRLDTYENAIPILEEYGLKATINITTDFICNPGIYSSFQSADNKAMSVEQVRELYQKGFEIASHGNRHLNDPLDVKESIQILHEWGIDKVYGFASPESVIDKTTIAAFEKLVQEGELCYIRSGRQVRRQGLVYCGLYVLQNAIKSKRLFYYLNKDMYVKEGGLELPELGASVSKDTTPEQLLYLADKNPDGTALILIFHSILRPDAPGYGKDKWYWDVEQFRSLCRELSDQNRYRVVPNCELYL